MGNKLRLLASVLKQAQLLNTHCTQPLCSSPMASGTMPPCCRSLLHWTRQSLSSSSTHSHRLSVSAINGTQAKPGHSSSMFLSTYAPGANGSRLFRSSAGLHTRGFTVRAAQQQHVASRDDALEISASTMRTAEASSAVQPSASTSGQGQASVEGTIQRITYSSEKTGYTVARMKVTNSGGFVMPDTRNSIRKSEVVTVTGTFPEMAVGQQWKCAGSWIKHQTFGHQLVAAAAEELRPASSGNLIAYLCGGATKGVGPVTAGHMVEEYGDAILDVLDSSDAVQKLAKVKGIGSKTASKIKNEWEKRRGDRGAREFLQKHGVSGSTAQKLVQKYGSKTEEAVRQDPYTCLATSATTSAFRGGEKLASLLGTTADLASRAGAAMLHALSHAAASNGHTYMQWHHLQKEAVRLMAASGRGWNGPALQEIAEDMFNKGDLIVEDSDSTPLDACSPTPHWDGPLRCYTPIMYNAEVTVAAKLAHLAARKELQLPGQLPGVSAKQRVHTWIASQKGMQLSEGQKAAVVVAATSPVCILTGGPGCGKTTTTKYIVEMWQSMGKRLALCAPTGRASQRLTETSGRQAATIHRLLKWVPSNSQFDRSSSDTDKSADSKFSSGAGGHFKYNNQNPLTLAEEGVDEEYWKEVDAVLVDEASMLDLPLAAALLLALPPKCQLVFVGDVDQLPPVGPGKVLSDAIQSGVIPGVDLREIFRQAQQSSIVRTAHAVNAGDFRQVQQGLPVLPPAVVQSGGYRQGLDSDAVMLEAQSPFIEKGVEAALTKLIHPLGKFNILRDVQVMSPMRKAAAGVNQLNIALQALLNPPAPDKPELPMGRFTTEDDSAGSVFRQGDRVVQSSNNYQKDVFNGDIGFVVRVKKSERELVVQYPDKEVTYTGIEMNEVQLAWASTVHKAQGSECPVVVLVLASHHRPLLTRRLLYTALTRAKQLVVVVGSWDALKLAVESETSDQRMSTLQQRISCLAVKKGAAANQKMVSYGATVLPPLQQIQDRATGQSHVPGQQQNRQQVRYSGQPERHGGQQRRSPHNRHRQITRQLQPAKPPPQLPQPPVPAYAQYAHSQPQQQPVQQVAATAKFGTSTA